MKKEELYYIQDSRSYLGNAILWWGLNSQGYTADLNKAQKYTKEEAIKILDETLEAHSDEEIRETARSVKALMAFS